MAAIDKIYGTQKQYSELRNWLKRNAKIMRIPIGITLYANGFEGEEEYITAHPIRFLYSVKGFNHSCRPISNFPEKIDMWLLKNCPLKWVTDEIKEQYDIKTD